MGDGTKTCGGNPYCSVKRAYGGECWGQMVNSLNFPRAILLINSYISRKHLALYDIVNTLVFVSTHFHEFGGKRRLNLRFHGSLSSLTLYDFLFLYFRADI